MLGITCIKLTENALKLLEKRYLQKDESGKIIETPEEMFRRVARTIAAPDRNYGKTEEEIAEIEEQFFDLMTSLRFLPNSPTLMNAGTPLAQLSACYVLPIDDSMDSIFETIKNAALTQKAGGGTGFSFSRLRPKGDVVQTTGGIAAGPIYFLKAFDSALKGIKQAHKRYSTNMGILRVDHPDILDFITSKQQEGAISTFNISIGLTDRFMHAIENGGYYELINPRNNKPIKEMSAKEIFDTIVENAWRNGEPGVIFPDTINKFNPTPHIGQIESTNPCAEVPLLPYESCNLGSINLSKMVIHENGKTEIDWKKLRETVRLAVHFLDNVIDANKYPIPEQENMAKANRKIGLGVMGWADILIKLKIPYDSEEGVKLAEKIMGFIWKEGVEKSVELATERKSFPNFNGSIWEKRGFKKMRNATITTIAPTSNLSIIAGCSHSIEPLFAISYLRNVKRSLGQNLIETNPLFEEVAKEYGFYSEELKEKVLNQGSLCGIEGIPEEVKRIFVTSHEISPEWHIRMQAIFQKFTDNAVSKTINFPDNATKEDIRQAYLLAYKLGCKGVTVYRDGSRQFQILNKGNSHTGI